MTHEEKANRAIKQLRNKYRRQEWARSVVVPIRIEGDNDNG